MKVLFDSSVLIASCIIEHQHHERALPWLLKALRGEFEFIVSTHTLLEVYAILSTYPISPKITPSLSRRFITDNIEKKAKIVPLNGKDYKKVLDKMVEMNFSGGIAYDALLVEVAEKETIDILLTFNEKHFFRLWPDGFKKIKVP